MLEYFQKGEWIAPRRLVADAGRRLHSVPDDNIHYFIHGGSL
jgi:hypothetical protein